MGKVTAALPLRDGRSRNFRIPPVSNLWNLQRYELEKIHSPQLHGAIRFRGFACDGADESAPFFNRADADANATRSHVKLHIRLPTPAQQQLRSE